MNIYRHGDLGISALKEIPKNLKKIYSGNEYVLAYGEATGHKHTLITEPKSAFDIFQDNDGNLFMKLNQPAKLTHQEHKTITIQPDFYMIRHEREFDYFENEIRQVRD